MLVSLTVGKVDAGVAVLLTQDKRLIEFPSILLPPNISSGSIVDITVARNFSSERKSQDAFLALQDSIFKSFGELEPAPPLLKCRNATQTSVVLEWEPIQLATADIISLTLYRNGQKAGVIPRPTSMQSTKISGLGVDTEYIFHLVLKTSAGTFSSEKVTVRTHKMTDLSGIIVSAGILPVQLRDSLAKAVERIGAKMADTVRIDTTHFVTTEGRGIAWERAVEMNIPVVRPEWVEGCERGGRIVGVRGYYLDADPRQRPVGQMSLQVQDSPQNSSQITSNPSNSGELTAGNNDVERAASVDSQRQAEESTDSTNADEASNSDEQQEAIEQKVRTEDLDGQKVALRPGTASTPGPSSSSNAVAEKQDSNEALHDGVQTPGSASFQDVAL